MVIGRKRKINSYELNNINNAYILNPDYASIFIGIKRHGKNNKIRNINDIDIYLAGEF